MAHNQPPATPAKLMPTQQYWRWFLGYALIFTMALGMWLSLQPWLIKLGVWEGPVHWDLQVAQAVNVIYLLIVNGLWLCVILGPAAVFGAGVLARCKLSQGCDKLWRAVSALGVGLLTMSLAVFGLGVMGLMGRGVYLVLSAVMALAGGGLLFRRRRRGQCQTAKETAPTMDIGVAVVLTVLSALAVLAALVPAGGLWAFDGRGFDVLEYHLQLPREYLENGRIGRIGHNAYSHFPQNMEMLYLAGLGLTGDRIAGMYLSQLLHLAVCGAFIAGIFALVRRWSGAGTALAAAAVAGGPLFYVATLAYNEGYLLLMMLLAAGWVLPQGEEKLSLRQAVLAGIFLGGACGAKYTAVAMAGPVVIIFAIIAGRARWKQLAVIALAALATFSPWLIKNVIWNGNPVFPLAAKTLGQSDWTDEQVARWNNAHAPAAEEAPAGVRLANLAREIIDPGRYGGAFWPLVLLVGGCFIARKRKLDAAAPQRLLAAAGLSFAVQLIIWLTATHLQSRFLLPMFVPLAILLGCIAVRCGWPARLLCGLALTVIIVHTIFIARSYAASTRIDNHSGFAPLAGVDEFISGLYPFSNSDAADLQTTNVLLVGESRPFYTRSRYVYHTVFDRCDLQDMLAAGASPADIAAAWRAKGITHIYIRWDEIDRLRRSYGFAPLVTPEFFQQMQPSYLEKINKQSPAFELLPGDLYRLTPAP